MLNPKNKEAFKQCLNKVYLFGQGVWQIKNIRENQSTLNETLQIENIEDVTSTFFDHYAKSPTFRDGKFCGKTFKLSSTRLRVIYPRLRKHSLKEVVEVADCWYKDKKQVDYLKLTTGEYKREDMIDDTRDTVEYGASVRKGIHTTLNYVRVVKGIDIFLEKEMDIGFTELPLIFNSGGMVWDDENGKYETYPFGWHLRDTQILLNYAGSVAASILKSTQADKWIFKAEHLQSADAKASADEINEREGGLIFTGNTQEIRREPSQQLPPQVGEMFMQLQGVLQTLAGSYFEQESDKLKGVSGVALDKLFMRMDMTQNPIILAHLEGVNQCGRALQSMIPAYFYQERLIAVKLPDGTQELTRINYPVPQPNGITIIENNIKTLANKYEYIVKLIPSPQLQKQNIQVELEKLYQIFPGAIQATIDLYAESLDIPIAEVLSKRLSVNIPPPSQCFHFQYKILRVGSPQSHDY